MNSGRPRLTVWYDNDTRPAEVEYALRQLILPGAAVSVASPRHVVSCSDTVAGDCAFVYADRMPDGLTVPTIWVHPSSFFDSCYGHRDSLPERAVGLPDGRACLYGTAATTLSSLGERRILETYCDMVASVFVMLTRYEEWIIGAADEYGRSPYGAVPSTSLLDYSTPVVDLWREQCRCWLAEVAGVALKSVLEEMKRPCQIALTHDIDWLTRYPGRLPPVHRAATAAIHGEAGRGCHLMLDWATEPLSALVGTRNPTVDCMKVEKKVGIPATYFVLPSKATRGHLDHGGDYDLHTRDVSRMVKSLGEEGHEIGLHVTRHMENAQVLEKERRALSTASGYNVVGARYHYLTWRVGQSWPQLEQAGFLYDSSLLYTEKTSFRCGTARAFSVFDVARGKELNLCEVPLLFMDTRTQREANYLTSDEFDIWSRQLAAASGGLASAVLVHPLYVNSLANPERVRMLGRLVCEHAGAWCRAIDLVPSSSYA